MNQTKLQLRGHHLALFAIEYWGNKFFVEKTSPSYTHQFTNRASKEELLKNKPLKKEDKPERTYVISNSDDFITTVYGKKMINTFNLVWHILKTQPDFEVEIVEGLDSICRKECPQLTTSCIEIRSGDEDQTTLEEYGLQVGETYTAKELIQRILEYSQKTGLRSPRDKILAQRGNFRFLC